MGNVSSLVKQLKQERDRVAQQLSGLNGALTAFAGVYSGNHNGKRQISAAGRKRIAAAQRARWAKVRGKAKVATPRRTMSAKSRAKIAAAQRRRWAKVRKANTQACECEYAGPTQSFGLRRCKNLCRIR